jgi:hypothetical protein
VVLPIVVSVVLLLSSVFVQPTRAAASVAAAAVAVRMRMGLPGAVF